MASYRFGLDFSGGDVNEGQVPGAQAYIYLKNWTEEDDGKILVSNQCLGPSELEGQVEKLKGELDEILQRGTGISGLLIIS